jgi:type II secretory pathway component PulC
MSGVLSETQPVSVQNFVRTAAAVTASLGARFAKLEIRQFLRRFDLTPVTTLMIILCMILGIWLLYDIIAPLPSVRPPKVTLVAHHAHSFVVKEFVPPPLEQFAAIDERPVFSPLRQAIKSAKDKELEAQLKPPPSFVLVGVILGNTERIAITRAPGANDSVNVTLGQMIEGWEVVRIEADHIELRTDSRDYQLQLYPPSAAPPGGAIVQASGGTQQQTQPTLRAN